MQHRENVLALARRERVDRHDQRRLVDDPALAVDLVGQLLERRHAVAGARLGKRLLRALDLPGRQLGRPLGQQRLDLEPCVPDGEIVLRREVAHRRAVLGDVSEHDPLLIADAEAVVAGGDQHADREPLDVPLPRPGMGLVEVIDVEDEPAFRRREHAEVRQVSVAAALDGQAGAGRRGEVRRHDQRRAAVEGERRDEHPPVADRNQLRHACRGLALEQLDGSGPVGRGLEQGVARARHLGPRGLAARDALGDRQVRQRRGWVSL